jgi:hypothetical protein
MAPLLDLYLYSPHEVPVWAPVLAPLRARGVDARFVLEPPGRNVARGSTPDPGRGWLDVKSQRLVDLVDARTEATILEDLANVGETPLRRRRARAAGGTTQGNGWLRPYAGAHVRSMYGVGFVTDAYGHGPINDGFDLVLAHGPFSAAEIRSRASPADVAVVGFPKWAAFRRGELSRDDARRRLRVVAGDRPLLAWLPTWAHNSSLDESDALARLSADFQVVMKPHHNSAKFEAARLSAVAGAITVVPATTSIVDLLVAADVVVSDVRSGGFTEGLLADRPVIGLARPVAGAGAHSSVHPGAAEAADVCEDVSDLPAVARRAVADDPHAAGRRRWVPELFGDTGGSDAQLAADALAEVVRRRQGPSPARYLSAVGWSVAYRGSRLVRR